MKILSVMPAYLPAIDYGGPVSLTARLYPYLQQNFPASLTVVVPNIARYGVKNTLKEEECLEGIRVLRLPVLWLKGFTALTHWEDSRIGTNWDLLLLNGAWTSIVYQGILFAIKYRLPWIWTPLGMFTTRVGKRLLKKSLTNLHYLLARKAVFIVGTSPREREEAPAIFTRLPWVFCPNPITFGALSPLPSPQECRKLWSLPESGRVFGYLGRIQERKGIPLLLSLWKKHSPPATLLFAGPPEDPALVQVMERTPGVRYLGTIPHKDVPLFLRCLTALILIPQWGENFGNVVSEALTVGTPVILSRAVGASYWLRNTKGVIILDHPERELPSWFHRDLPRPQGIPEFMKFETLAQRYFTLLNLARNTFEPACRS